MLMISRLDIRRFLQVLRKAGLLKPVRLNLPPCVRLSADGQRLTFQAQDAELSVSWTIPWSYPADTLVVPTTLLTEQHFQNFADRFADWPVKIAELSRFKSGKELKAAMAGLADGSVDIVIGTHRLTQPDVEFARLGLVIIDEEHRFGVRQKEQLKRLRANVDVLTLTATPIPRTLAMSLEGLRDFSVIATAPQKRLAIKTFVSKFSDGIIREAVLRELKRGGQVWNRVFPDVPVSKKPLEVRMGAGKGNVEYWVAKVLPGKVLFEIEGVDEAAVDLVWDPPWGREMISDPARLQLGLL